MLTKEQQKLLNDQITMELYSSVFYMSMSSWCHFNGLEGCGSFFDLQAKEEQMHMQKLVDYVSETGGQPIYGSLEAPPHEFESLIAVFKQTLDHERMITRSINNLVDTFLKDKDFATFNFLQWYVAEQHEEEHQFMTILDKIELIGTDKKSLYWVDQEIASIAKNKASAGPA